MNVNEFRKRYLDTIEEDISGYERSIKDPEFDMLVELSTVDSQFLYSLFYYFTSDLKRFDEICKIYDNLSYCWNDDGDISLVHAILTDGDGYFPCNIFTISGFFNELRWDVVEKVAIKHHSEGITLQSYSSIIFNKEVFVFIHSLIPYIENVKKLGGGDDYRKYYKAENELNQKIIDYINTRARIFHKEN